MQAKANIDALGKQATLHAMAILKGEVVNQFTIDHLGSTASSVSFATIAWQRTASPAMPAAQEPPLHLTTLSWLGVPTLSSPDINSMPAASAYPPIVDLNCTPLGGKTSSEHSKAPRARAVAGPPDMAGLFGPMPTQPTTNEVLS
jgi:hypothetical protein